MTVADLIRELARRPFDQEVTVRVVAKDGRLLAQRETLAVDFHRAVPRQGDAEPPVELSIRVGAFCSERAAKDAPCDGTTQGCRDVLKCAAHGGICQDRVRRRKGGR